MFPILKNTSFARFEAVDGLSTAGDWALQVLGATLIVSDTHNPWTLWLPLAMQWEARAVFSYVGGKLADKWPRLRIIMLGEVLRGLMLTAFAIKAMVDHLVPSDVIIWQLGTGFIEGTSSPSSAPLIREIVGGRSYQEAVALDMAVTWATGPIGALLGGFALPATVLALDAATSFLLAFYLVGAPYGRERPLVLAAEEAFIRPLNEAFEKVFALVESLPEALVVALEEASGNFVASSLAVEAAKAGAGSLPLALARARQAESQFRHEVDTVRHMMALDPEPWPEVAAEPVNEAPKKRRAPWMWRPAGWEYVMAHPSTAWAVSLVAVLAIGTNGNLQQPRIAVFLLGNPQDYTYILLVDTLAVLAMSLLLARRKEKKNTTIMRLIAMCMASSLLGAVYASSHILWLSLACIGSGVVVGSIVDISQIAIIVDGVPADWRGRVNALASQIRMQVMVLSTLTCALIGWLWPGAWGVTWGSWTCSMVSLCLLAACTRKLSQARRKEAALTAQND